MQLGIKNTLKDCSNKSLKDLKLLSTAIIILFINYIISNRFI